MNRSNPCNFANIRKYPLRHILIEYLARRTGKDRQILFFTIVTIVTIVFHYCYYCSSLLLLLFFTSVTIVFHYYCYCFSLLLLLFL